MEHEKTLHFILLLLFFYFLNETKNIIIILHLYIYLICNLVVHSNETNIFH